MADDNLITDPDKPESKDTVTLEPTTKKSRIQGNPDAVLTDRSLPGDVQMQFDKDAYEPYVGNMVNPITQDNLADLRAYKQSGWEQARRAVAQGVLGEFAGGAIETAGYLAELFDTESTLYKGIDGYNNALVELGQNIKESVKDKWEVYDAPSEGFGGEGWFWANAPTIGTSFALLLPTGLATAGVKMGLNVAKKTAMKSLIKGARKAGGFSKVPASKRFAYQALKGTQAFEKAMPYVQAGMSRAAEGQMEAQQFWEQKYEELMATGKFSEEQAKTLASKGASDIFKKNWILMAQDIGQMKLFRGLFKIPGAKGAGISADGFRQSNVYKIGKDMIGEGMEEGIQYVISEEADYLVDRAAGLVDQRSVGERIKSYDRGEIATSMFFGALGAGVMQGAGAIAGRYRKTIDTGIDPLEDMPDDNGPSDNPPTPANDPDSKSQVTKKFNMTDLLYDTVNTVEDPYEKVLAVRDFVPLMAFDSIKQGTEESSRQAFDAMLDMSDQELLEQFGQMPNIDVTDQLRENLKQTWDIASEEFKKVEKYGSYADSIANSNTKARLYAEQGQQQDSYISEQIEAYPKYNELSKADKGQQILDLTIKKKALKEHAKNFTKNLKSESRKTYIENRIDEELKDTNETLDSIAEQDIDNKKVANRNRIIKGSASLVENMAKLKARSLNDLYTSEFYKDKSDNLVEQYKKKSKEDKKKSSEKSKFEFGDQTPDDLDESKGKKTKKDGKNKFVFEEYPDDLGDMPDVSETPDNLEGEDVEIPKVDTKKLRVHPEGKQAQVGDFIKTNADPEGKDLYYVTRETPDGNYEIVNYSNKNIKAVITPTDLKAYSVFIEAGTSTQPTKDENEDGEPYEDKLDETYAQKGIKKTSVWSGAWLSSNNSWREDDTREDATEESNALTNFLENQAPIEEGVFGIPEVTDTSVPLENLTDSQILNLDMHLRLKNPDGSQITSPNDIEITLPIHNENFLDQLAVPEGMTPEEAIDHYREILLEKKKELVEALKKGEEIKVPIISKGTGVINFRKHANNHPVRNNVAEVFGTLDIPIAVMDDVGDFVIGTDVHPEFSELFGNATQRGRPYTKTVTANGTEAPVPLDKAKLNSGEVDIIMEITKGILNGNANAKVDARILNMAQNEDRVSPLLTMFPEMSNIDLLNMLIYESARTVNPNVNKQFHIDLKKKVITVSKTKDDVEYFSVNDLNNNSAELKDYLKSHYRNISKSALTNPDYKDYLLSNEIVTAQFEAKDLFVQPVVYFGDAYIQEQELPHNEQSEESSEESSESKGDLFWGEDVAPDSEAPFQMKDLAGTVEGNIVPLIENLSIRTGWGYELINNADVKWAGKVEGNTMFFNLAYASENTAFHEYAHPIIRQIKNEKPLLYQRLLAEARAFDEYNITYNSVRQNNPSYSRDMAIEETLVQLIGDLASNNIKSSGLKSIIHRIWNQILKMVQRLMPSVSISSLKENTSLKDIADLLNSNSFIATSKNPLFGYSKVAGSKKQYDDWTNLLLHSVLNRNNMDISQVKDPDDLDFTVLAGVVQWYHNNAKTTSQKEAVKDLVNGITKLVNTSKGKRRIIDQDSEYIATIKEKIKKFGTFNPLEGQEDLFTEEVEADEKNRMRNVKDGYEINHKDKISEDVKFLMSFIPKRDESGNLVFKPDSGVMDFHSFNDIWNTLIKELSDTEAVIKDGKREDLFEKYMSKIKDIAQFRPEFNTLISRIRNKTDLSISKIGNDSYFKDFNVQVHNPNLKGLDETFRERFVRTFNLVNQNYVTIQSNTSTFKGNQYIYFKTIEKNPQSAEWQILKSWKNKIIQNFIDYSDINNPKVNTEYISYLESLREKAKKAYTADRTQVSESAKTIMKDMLMGYGLEMSNRELNYYLKTQDKSERAAYKDLFNAVKRWNDELRDVSEITQSTEWFTETQTSSTIPLAEAKAFFNQDLSDNNVLGPDNKILYNYATPTMMHKYINEWKENPEHLLELAKHPFYRTSRWRDHILAGKDIKLVNNINYKSQYDKGNRPKDLNLGDRMAQSLNMTMNGYFPLHARGSNSTEYFIKGPEFFEAHSIIGDSNDVDVNDTAINIMVEYVKDELDRIKHEKQYMKDNPDKLIQGYHTVDSKIGNIPALRIHTFPELNGNQELFDKNGNPRENISPKIRKIVSELIGKEITETIKAFNNSNIFDLGEHNNNGFDSALFKQYYSKFQKDPWSIKFNKAVTAITTDYVINTMIANKEQQKLFSGDPALYKNQAELQKRILSSGSGGYAAYIPPNMPEEFRSATIEDVEISSRQLAYFKSMGIEGYDKFNAADGQSWVTYELFERMLRAYGKWKPEYDQISYAIKNKKDIPKGALGRFATALNASDFSAQPLKTVGAELVTDGPKGMAPRFIYDKQSILPIIPGYSDSSPEMAKIVDIMNRNKIDHMSSISGTKTGSLTPVKIHDDNGAVLDPKDIELNTYTQSLRFTFLQQDLPKKLMGPILDPSQAKHNIYVDLVEGELYGGRSRKDTIKLINDIQGALSQKGREALEEEILEDGQLSITKINAKLGDMMTQRKADRNLIDGLAQGLPIEALITHNIPIQNNLASIFNTSTVKLKHSNGMSGIQISEFGFVNRLESLTDQERDGIIWLKEGNLEPPMLDEDGTFHPGSILVPHKLVEQNPDILNNPKKLREALRGIDARIPNQALSNIGYFEVAGILPPEAGDSVVVYGEITNKTGSDFDIDKIILQFYNLDNDFNIIEYKEADEVTEEHLSEVYQDRKKYDKSLEGVSESAFIKKHKNSSPLQYNSKVAIENHKLNTYRDILSNKEAYKRMMEILDSNKVRDAFEKDIEGYKPNSEYNSANRFNPLNGLYQVFTREIFIDANSAVGVVANHSTDHPQAQYAELYLQKWNPSTQKMEPYHLGIGDKTKINGKPATTISKAGEKDIAGYLKELMTAMVDAEKDPWAAIANMNLSTINSVITMFRIGLNADFVSTIVRHPIVRNYIFAKREMGTTFTFSDKTALQLGFDKYVRAEKIGEERAMKMNEEYLKEINLKANPQTDLDIIKFYLEIERISGELSESIRGSKFTVNGLGKNVFDAISMMRSKGNVNIGNFKRKFFNNQSKTMEQYFYENSIEFFMEAFGNKMIATSNGFMGERVTEESSSVEMERYQGGLITQFATMMGLDLTNQNKIKAVYDGLLPYVLYNKINPDIHNLIGKETSVAKDVLELQEQTSNPFIQRLQVELGAEYDLVSFPNSIKLSEEGRDMISDGWLELYQNNDTRDLAIRLAKYSFASSGFKFGINSFFQFMPTEINKALGIPQAIEEAIIEGRDSGAFLDAFDQIIMNNASNQDLVPKASKKDFVKKGKGKIQLTSQKSKFEDTPKYISTSINDKTQLYVLEDIDDKLYQETTTLGMQEDGYNFVEYDNIEEIDSSYFSNLNKPKEQYVIKGKPINKKSKEVEGVETKVEPKKAKKEFKIHQYKMRLKDGEVVYKNGTAVESQKLINMFETVEAQDAGRMKKFIHSNRTEYAAIINFNGEFKIVSLSKTNTGGEVYEQGSPQRKQILEQHPEVLKLYKDYCKGA